MKNSLVKEIKKKYKKIKFRDFNLWRLFFEPSKVGIFISISLIIVFYLCLILYSKYFYVPIFFKKFNYSNGLISDNIFDLITNVHIGVLSLFFALAILIAGNIYTSDSEEKNRILLQYSLIFPLFLVNVFILVSFPFSKILFDPYLQIFPVFFNAVFVMIAFYRTLNILLNKDKLLKSENLLIKNKFKKYLKQLILERLSKNYRFEGFKFNNILFENNRYTSFNNYFYLNKSGFILDIKLLDLKKILHRIDNYLEKKSNLKIQKNINIVEKNDDLIDEPTKQIKIFLNKGLYDYININNPKIMGISDKTIFEDTGFLKSIQKRLNYCFKVKDRESPQEKLDIEIKNFEYLFLESLRQKNQLNIKRYSDLYISFIRLFTESIQPIGKYNYEDAQKERTIIGGSWENLNYINDSITHLLDEVIIINDRNILYNMISLVYKIITTAMSDGDHLIYQKFLWLFKYLYNKSSDIDNKSIKDFLLNKIWFILLEISNPVFSVIINKKKYYNYNENNKDFAFPLLKNFQDLIKESIDNKDFDYFQTLAKEFNNTFNRFYHERNQELIYLELEINNAIRPLNDEDHLFININFSKKMIYFSLSAYVLHCYQNKKIDNLEDYLVSLLNYLPNELDKIILIYIKMTDIENDSKWGWLNWYMESKSVPEAKYLDFEAKFSLLFVYILLKKIDNFDFNEKKFSKIIDRNLYHEIKKDGDLRKLLDKKQIIEELNISNDELTKIDEIKRLFNKLSELYLKIENERITQAQLSNDKIIQFRIKFLSAYYDYTGLKQLYIQNKHYKNKIQERTHQNNKIKGGFNQIINKELYIDNPHSIIDVTQGHWAIGMVDFENNTIIKKIINYCKKIDVSDNELIEKLIGNIQEKSIKYLIITTFDNFHSFSNNIFNRDNFQPEWNIENNKKYIKSHIFKGFFIKDKLNIPILNININSEKLQNKLILIDENKIGDFIQLNPAENYDDKNIFEIFYIKFTDLNADNERRNKILSSNPSWLKSEVDKEKYLSSKVVLEIYESFVVNIEKENIGFIFYIQQDE